MGVANSLRAMHEQNKGHMTKTNLFMADLDLLEEEDGFNIGRDYEDPDVVQHIRNLADAYIAGEDLPPLIVKVVDGRILVRDGHCRRRGALLARSEGCEINRLAVLESKGDEIDQTMILLTSNDGLKQKPLGRAKIYAKLISMGLTEDEVAKKIKKTKPHVMQYLALHNLPIKLKELIKNDVIAWSMALELFNEHGTKAIELIQSHHQQATPAVTTGEVVESTGIAPSSNADDAQNENSGSNAPKQKRITRKMIDSSTGYRSRLTGTLVKDVTDRIGSVVKSISEAQVEGDHVLVRMSKEEAEALRALHQNILPPSSEGKEEQADELYEAALAYVTESAETSVSALQRQLEIDINRATRLLDALARNGVISKADKKGKRELLLEASI